MKIKDLTRKVYIDMDGVIAAAGHGAAHYNNIPLQTFLDAGYPNKYWNKILINGDIKQLFIDLPWESNGKRLLSWFTTRNIPFTFLTKPSDHPYTTDCIEGKKIWLHSHGLNNIPVIFSFNKEKYAGVNNILIDDLESNIKKWNTAGGIGLLYNNSAYDNTLTQLEKLF